MGDDLETTILFLRTARGGKEIDLNICGVDTVVEWISNTPNYDHYYLAQLRVAKLGGRTMRTTEIDFVIYPYDMVREELARCAPGAQDKILARVNVKKDEDGDWVRPDDVFNAYQRYLKS